jgi:hypothetical protein
MIIEIRDFIKTLAIVDSFTRINVDYLGETPTEYVLEPIPTERVIKKYMDGSTLNQYVFQFGSREYYTSDVIENMQKSEFYEDFEKCINWCNREDILPNIQGIQSIECLNVGSIQDTSNDTAKYAIQMRITYFREYNEDGGCAI